MPYPHAFKKVLGAQEFFPLTKTKGLKNLPPDLLHTTAEAVNFGGIEIFIPELELLFLDKYFNAEISLRPEGAIRN